MFKVLLYDWVDHLLQLLLFYFRNNRFINRVALEDRNKIKTSRQNKRAAAFLECLMDSKQNLEKQKHEHVFHLQQQAMIKGTFKSS